MLLKSRYKSDCPQREYLQRIHKACGAKPSRDRLKSAAHTRRPQQDVPSGYPLLAPALCRHPSRIFKWRLPSQPGRKHHYIPVFYRLGNKRQNKETTNLQDFPEIQHRLMDTQQLEFRIVDGLQHFERYHRTLGYGLQCGG
jgi:hypothetical protein